MTFQEPTHFSVSQIRAAASCPRILYFDTDYTRRANLQAPCVTRIWKTGSDGNFAAGGLFHNSVERFNRYAAEAVDLRDVLSVATDGDSLKQELLRLFNLNCLNRALLVQKPADVIENFTTCVHTYFEELADIIAYARSAGHSMDEVIAQLFSDKRKRVDVTFHVGTDREPVHVTGQLDYVFYDWRAKNTRIMDYKLTPSDDPNRDLFQVFTYALMHRLQHGTTADVAVFYLFPKRWVVEEPWVTVWSHRHKIYDLLASMLEWARFDEQTLEGLKPPGEPTICSGCRWNKICEDRLGPKSNGSAYVGWSVAAAEHQDSEPEIEHREPPEPGPALEYVDSDEEATAEEIAGSPSATAVLAPGIELGTTVAGSKPIVIPVAALKTHISVMGSAGSGKSYLAKVVAEEAIRQGIPVLAIDPQGDLVQFLHAAQLPPEATATERQAQAEFRQRAEVRIWTPGTSHGIRLSLSPLRLPKEADLLGSENPQRRREEWDALLSVAAGNLVQLAQAGGDEEVQRTFLLEILRALTTQAANRCDLGLSDIVAALAGPESLGLEEAGEMISKRDREKLKQKLNVRLRGPTSGLFTGGTPLDLDRFIRPLDDGATPLNVIYLNALSDDDQKQYFVAALAAEIYRWMITSPSTGSARLLVYLDEAKDFLPAGSSKPPAKEPLLRLFAQGRKFGVSCLICTQSPRSVDYNVFSNASTKLIGRLEAAQDVQRVAEWFNDGSGQPTWLPGRNGAKNHTFAGRWPDVSAELEGAEFRSRRLYSLHEAAWSPDQVETQWAKSPLAAWYREQAAGIPTI